MPEYSKEQLKGLYESIPKKLQDALYSEENGKSIKEICQKNKIEDSKMLFEINKYVGFVLLGLLAPDKLPSVFEKELKIKKDVSEELSSQIGHSVFYPVKDILEPLYGIKMVITDAKKEEGPDTYRESTK